MTGFGPAAEAACIVRSERRNLCAAKGPKTSDTTPALIGLGERGLRVGRPTRGVYRNHRRTQTRPVDG